MCFGVNCRNYNRKPFSPAFQLQYEFVNEHFWKRVICKTFTEESYTLYEYKFRNICINKCFIICLEDKLGVLYILREYAQSFQCKCTIFMVH